MFQHIVTASYPFKPAVQRKLLAVDEEPTEKNPPELGGYADWRN
jgi:hypothetical protein